MIETPVKAPPPSGPPSAPPPDARTRVMDLPPDPNGRHVHACSECGLPLHEDQAACLSCGAMVEQGSGYAGIRRAAVGSATALLVLGSAVGAAVAGLPHGKDVPKKTAGAQVFNPKKVIPPATAEAAPGADGATDLPSADSGSKPPAIAPKAPKGSDSTSLPDMSATTGGSTGSGLSGGGGSGSGSKVKTNGEDTGKKTREDEKAKPPKPAGPQLYPTGDHPASATVFTTSGPSGASGADYTIDSGAKTAWSTKTGDRGVMVTPSPGDYRAVGIITETPGWSLQIWRTNVDSPGGLESGDWAQAGIRDPVGRRAKLSVKDAKHYLVWVVDTAGKRVRINEIQVFQ
ncbi:MAG TPA: hypothetical protein VJT75_14145 [Thermoleophilaceae bacterium]|nr:hypothetical protein [Thermoleophilaceae bacterium]